MKVGDLVYHKHFKLLGVGLIVDSAIVGNQYHGSVQIEKVKMFFVQFAKDRRSGIYSFYVKDLCKI
jgi:hypothetical protein